MKPICYLAAFAAAFTAQANEVLDILEADKKPESMPPVGEAAGAPAATITEYPEYVWPEWQTRTFDPVWSRAVLFDDDAHPWIQHLAITGFFQWHAASGTAEVDAVGSVPAKNVDLDSSRTRNARLGARIRAFSNTRIEAIGELADGEGGPGIERLKARTEYLPGAGVTYGKFRPQFTAEYRQEEEFSPYPDRAMLVNMIAPATTLGIHLDYNHNDWDYGLGWFSGDADDDIPSVDADGMLVLNLGRSFVSGKDGVPQRTRWHLDYIHNFDAARSGSIPRYHVAGRRSANGNQLVGANPGFRHLLATGFTLEQERFSFLGDFMLAKGDSSVWGLTLAPAWWAVPGYLRIVGRYHYAAGNDPGSLVATMGASADPWFDSSPFFIGDEYHSFYLGANAHLYRDRIVLMTGIENIILGDNAGAGFNTDAWIWHAGLKVSF
jgi:hypothetical protein